MAAAVSVEREIGAPVEKVWGMITDVARMGEWSPETVSARWIGGASGPALGARFKGSNRNRWHRWSAACEVTELDHERRFSFEPRVAGRPYCTWTYELEPRGEGACLVRESWTDKRGWWLRRVLGPVATGVSDRATHNRATMTETLDRLAAAAAS